MPRPFKIDRPVQVCLQLPTSVVARMDMHLWSSLEGRVPYGKRNEFLGRLIAEFFEERRLELEAFGLPAGFFITGPKEMVDALERRLKGETTENTGSVR